MYAMGRQISEASNRVTAVAGAEVGREMDEMVVVGDDEIILGTRQREGGCMAIMLESSSNADSASAGRW